MWFRRNFAHRTELLQQQAPYLHRILDDGAYSAKAAGAVIDYRIRGYLRSATVITRSILHMRKTCCSRRFNAADRADVSLSSNFRRSSTSIFQRVPCEREYLFGGGGCHPANDRACGR